jgi:hypothetical protein
MQDRSQQQVDTKPTISKTKGTVLISEHNIEANNKARSRALSGIAYDEILKIHKDKELQL